MAEPEAPRMDGTLRFAREEGDEGTSFVVHGLDEEGTARAVAAGFAATADGVRKGPFAAGSSYVDEAWAGLQRHAAALFNTAQRGDWQVALDETMRRLRAASVDVFVVGSAALAARGVVTEPGDIDLVVTQADAVRVGAVFVDDLVQPVARTEGWIAKVFGRAVVAGFQVEWAGGVEASVDEPEPTDFGPEARRRADLIAWRGHQLLVPPLDLSLAVNERRGRTERAAAIRAFSA